jgi:hypothetical protein
MDKLNKTAHGLVAHFDKNAPRKLTQGVIVDFGLQYDATICSTWKKLIKDGLTGDELHERLLADTLHEIPGLSEHLFEGKLWNIYNPPPKFVLSPDGPVLNGRWILKLDEVGRLMQKQSTISPSKLWSKDADLHPAALAWEAAVSKRI